MGEDGQGPGDGLEHQLFDAVPGPLHRFAKILRRRGLHRNQMHLHLEPQAGHPHRLADAILIVNLIFLRDVMQELTVLSETHRGRHLIDPLDIGP